MKGFNHITAGRTAIKVLLVAVVLTAGIASTVGTEAAKPIDVTGNDSSPLALDGSSVATDTIDETWDGGEIYAFPYGPRRTCDYEPEGCTD